MSSACNAERHDKTVIECDDEDHRASKFGWKALFGFTTNKHLPLLLGGLITAFIAATTLPLFAIVYGLIFHAYTEYGAGGIDSNKLLGSVTEYCIMLCGITSLSWIMNSCCLSFFLIFAELQARSARSRIFETLINKDMAWFDTQKTGITALLPAIQTHIRELQLSLSAPFGEAVQCIVQCLGALSVAFYYSWSLTLVIISTVPLIALVQSVLDARLSIRAQKHTDQLQNVLKYATSAIQNIETVKSFNGERHELQSFTKLVSRAGHLYNRVANYRSIQIGIMQFFTLSVFFQAFWYGSHLVGAGDIDIGQVITTFWAALMAIQGITGFLPQFIVLQKGQMAAARLRELMEPGLTKNQPQQSRGQLKPVKVLGDIEFKQVTFSYPTRTESSVLDEVSLYFPAHDTTFIIGKSGSGKSTLAQLLVRLYAPSSGKILIDRVPLEKLNVEWIRNNITVVEQNGTLFNDSIYENIALGRKNKRTCIHEIQASISFARLDSTIEELPDGLDTQLGRRGGSLSGGQRQRVALARAKVRNAPVLILDESTSALDYVTRSEILKAIREWRKGKTTIIITHEISQILPDDYVYVLENARLVQEGYRTKLETQPGPFQSFVASNDQGPPYGDPQVDEYSDTNNRRFSVTSLSGEEHHSQKSRRSMQCPFSTRLFGEDLLQASPSAKVLEELLEAEEQEDLDQVIIPSLRIREILESVWPVLDWQARLLLFVTVVCAVIHSAATPAFSWVFAQLLTTFYHTEDQMRRSLSFALSMLVISVADGIACYLMFFFSDCVAQSWAVKLKIQAMRRILNQPREFFDLKENSITQLSETLDRFGEEARNLPGRFACVFLVVIFMVAISIIWSLITVWKLALVALATSPILYVTTTCYNMISNRWERRSSEATDEVGEVLHETFTNIRTVRCFVLEGHFRNKFKEATTAAVKIGLKRAIYSGSFFGLNYSSVLFIAILLFWYGAVLISTNQYSVTAILEAFLVLILSMNHVVHMSNYITQVNMARDAGSRLLRLARLPTSSHELDGLMQIQRADNISFNKVSFTYPNRPEQQILTDVSFDISKGSCTAIVGFSGSGKSTVAALLLKLYRTAPEMLRAFDAPDISISNQNIRTLHTISLRSRIAIVPQFPVLFPGTIAENITYGLSASSPFTTRESIIDAAEAAGVSDFIGSLPQGYQTLVGEGGTGLSGGQAQRIAIARALVRKPDILILDEATSALDAISAGIVRDTVRGLTRKAKLDRHRHAHVHAHGPTISSATGSSHVSFLIGKHNSIGGAESHSNALVAPGVMDTHVRPRKETTVIIITHSQPWMELADQIIMLDHGRVVEQGTYGELKSKRGGAFAKMLRAREEISE